MRLTHHLVSGWGRIASLFALFVLCCALTVGCGKEEESKEDNEDKEVVDKQAVIDAWEAMPAEAEAAGGDCDAVKKPVKEAMRLMKEFEEHPDHEEGKSEAGLAMLDAINEAREHLEPCRDESSTIAAVLDIVDNI